MTSPSETAHRLGWVYPAALLRISLGAGIAVILAVAVFLPWAAPYLPLLFAGGVIGWFLFSHPHVNLLVIIGGFALVASHQEGVDPLEVAYSVFFIAYLAQWYFTRIVLSPEPLLRSTVDYLIVSTLVLVVSYAGIALVFEARPPAIVAELSSWALLAFYFPVKELVERRDDGLKWLMAVLIGLGLFVVVRNVYSLAQMLINVTEVWHVTLRARVVTNELLMVVPGFILLLLAVQTRRWGAQVTYFALFLTMLFGLIVTQGRGYWLAFALGFFVLLIVVDRRTRVSMVLWLGLAIAGCIGVIFLLFYDYAILLVTGLFNRLLSFGQATSRDISLISRFIESEAVMKDIARNPIMGYGMGVPISYFDITRSVTMVRPWIHNGYIGVWFKYGILGLGLILGFTFVSIRSAFLVARRRGTGVLHRVGAYSALASFVVILIVANVNSTWYNTDTILMIAIITGITSGCHARSTT